MLYISNYLHNCICLNHILERTHISLCCWSLVIKRKMGEYPLRENVGKYDFSFNAASDILCAISVKQRLS